MYVTAPPFTCQVQANMHVYKTNYMQTLIFTRTIQAYTCKLSDVACYGIWEDKLNQAIVGTEYTASVDMATLN